MKNVLVLILFAIIVVLAVVGYRNAQENVQVASFSECIAAGNPVMESYPRQCRTPEGVTFTENIGNELEKEDMIRIDTPRPNTTVQSPLQISGVARGNWYFEASFPVRIEDANGNVLGQVPAQAVGEWMTTEFVPFNTTLTFTQPTTATGTLILQKDNASGLPEHDDALIVPIVFGTAASSGTNSTGTTTSNENPTLALCQPTGCSGQICSDQEVATTCEYREEYSCYQSATCERQANGSCGWTQTEALTMCINSARAGLN